MQVDDSVPPPPPPPPGGVPPPPPPPPDGGMAGPAPPPDGYDYSQAYSNFGNQGFVYSTLPMSYCQECTVIECIIVLVSQAAHLALCVVCCLFQQLGMQHVQCCIAVQAACPFQLALALHVQA